MQRTLKDMIKAITRGTKLHISVVFLGNHGNSMTALPYKNCIHSTEICDTAKSSYKELLTCIRCRNTVLRRVVRTKKPLGGHCVNGIYEYCHPVVRDGETVCVIFVGHIRSGNIAYDRLLYDRFSEKLVADLETDFTEEDCKITADLLEEHILRLLEKFGDGSSADQSSLIENVKSYIRENLYYDFSLKEAADFFGYNEKYLGRKFKEHTGLTVKEYTHRLRIDSAKEKLYSTDLKISEIAGMVGFNNVTYFNRIFMREVAVTPAQYRKERKGGSYGAEL